MMAEANMQMEREQVAGKVPVLLRMTLHATNPIQRMVSIGRTRESNIMCQRDSKARQRCLAAVLPLCEERS